jgi:uncharacterized protein
MPALRQRSRYITLVIVIGVSVVAVLDSLRAPEKQTTVTLYATGVHAYRLAIAPIVRKWVRCRFLPTCSEYSLQAVKRHGIRKGLWLTIYRLHRCRTNVRIGTFDPVPPADQVHSR